MSAPRGREPEERPQAGIAIVPLVAQKRPTRAWLSWSSGKDSAWALHVMRSDPAIDVAGLLTTVTQPFDRVSMHGVRRALLQAQAEATGLPLHVVEIPSPCPNEVYAARMTEAIERAHQDEIGVMAFGDLFLDDVRAYRERMLEPTGIRAHFPLWGRPTRVLSRDMIAGGLRAVVTCVDPRRVPASLAGREYDQRLLDQLPADADPCAENGEFHTLAIAGPMFRSPLAVRRGEIVERDGFVFCDVLPSDDA
jgi:uncharacterized protein (TIGR00290 family)